MKRFEALDSVRGVSACMIVVLHAHYYLRWSFEDALFLQGFGYFVDFFFVLSGFVIAYAYENRLTDTDSLVSFMLRRFGRLYPLHIATLFALLAMRLVLALYPFDMATYFSAVFDNDVYTASSLVSYLFLLQSMGVLDHLTWNQPSWSISVEFYTYLVFAGLWVLMLRTPKSARWMNVFYATLLVVCPLILLFVAPNGMDSIADFAFVRCLLGFAIGVLTWRVYERLKNWRAGSLPGGAASLLELVLTAALLFLIFQPGGTRWLVVAPYLLGGLVLVFAHEDGVVSRVLKFKPLLGLGAISYSIYMVHDVVTTYQRRLAFALEDHFGFNLTTIAPESGLRVVGGPEWTGDFVIAANGAVVVGLSVLTYRLIEQPGRSWGARLSNRWRARRQGAVAVETPPSSGTGAAR